MTAQRQEGEMGDERIDKRFETALALERHERRLSEIERRLELIDRKMVDMQGDYIDSMQGDALRKRVVEIERRLGIDLSTSVPCGGCERPVPWDATSCPHCGIPFAGHSGKVRKNG